MNDKIMELKLNLMKIEKYILSNLSIDNIVKFHQSTTSYFVNNDQLKNPEKEKWLELSRNFTLLNNLDKKESKLISLDRTNSNKNSDYCFLNNESLVEPQKLCIQNLSGNIEGVENNKIFHLLYILNPHIVKGVKECGCYIIDHDNSSLHLLKEINEKDKLKLINNMFPFGKPEFTDLIFGFAIDLVSFLIEEENRGYRNALLKVGESTNIFYNYFSHYQDVELVKWNNFNDNSVTFHSGLNIRLCPVISLHYVRRKK